MDGRAATTEEVEVAMEEVEEKEVVARGVAKEVNSRL